MKSKLKEIIIIISITLKWHIVSINMDILYFRTQSFSGQNLLWLCHILSDLVIPGELSLKCYLLTYKGGWEIGYAVVK